MAIQLVELLDELHHRVFLVLLPLASFLLLLSHILHNLALQFADIGQNVLHDEFFNLVFPSLLFLLLRKQRRRTHRDIAHILKVQPRKGNLLHILHL